MFTGSKLYTIAFIWKYSLAQVAQAALFLPTSTSPILKNLAFRQKVAAPFLNLWVSYMWEAAIEERLQGPRVVLPFVF